MLCWQWLEVFKPLTVANIAFYLKAIFTVIICKILFKKSILQIISVKIAFK